MAWPGLRDVGGDLDARGKHRALVADVTKVRAARWVLEHALSARVRAVGVQLGVIEEQLELAIADVEGRLRDVAA